MPLIKGTWKNQCVLPRIRCLGSTPGTRPGGCVCWWMPGGQAIYVIQLDLKPSWELTICRMTGGCQGQCHLDGHYERKNPRWIAACKWLGKPVWEVERYQRDRIGLTSMQSVGSGRRPPDQKRSLSYSGVSHGEVGMETLTYLRVKAVQLQLFPLNKRFALM